MALFFLLIAHFLGEIGSLVDHPLTQPSGGKTPERGLGRTIEQAPRWYAGQFRKDTKDR